MIQDVLTRFEQYNKEMSPLGDAMDGTKLQAQLQQYKRIRITGNYILPTDIVLCEGMTLLIDQAVVSWCIFPESMKSFRIPDCRMA